MDVINVPFLKCKPYLSSRFDGNNCCLKKKYQVSNGHNDNILIIIKI